MYIKRVTHAAAERLSLAWGAPLGACKSVILNKLYIALAGAHGRLIVQRVGSVQRWFEGQAESRRCGPWPGTGSPARDPFFAGGEAAVLRRVQISRRSDPAKVRTDGDPCIQWWCKAMRDRQQGSELQLAGVAPRPQAPEADLAARVADLEVGAG